jgi:hypothetical protein
MCYASTQRTVRKFHLRPYRIRAVQELKSTDTAKRLQYCRWFRSFVQQDGINVLDTVYFSDEACFHLDGYMNSQKCRIWSSKYPYALHEKPIQPQKNGLWCDLSCRRSAGPIFFQTAVKSEVHQDMITQLISVLEEDERHCWLQQYGATCHTFRETMNFLKYYSDNRLIPKAMWSPRSPDLSSTDLSLWDQYKRRTHTHLRNFRPKPKHKFLKLQVHCYVRRPQPS